MRFLIAAVVALVAMQAYAQFPSRPIRIVVGLAPGGPSDGAARAIAEPLARALGQPVLVENKPGAEGLLAVEAVRRSAADGYTLLWGQPTNMVIAPLLRGSPDYDPSREFTPVSFVGRLTLCLFAHPAVKADTLQELVALARSQPGGIAYATNTAIEAVVALEISKAAGISMVRVPYKGGTSAIADLIGGRIQLGFLPASIGMPLAREGRLRVLASLLPRRTAAVPGVPTLAEAGFGQAAIDPWFGLFGPLDLPGDVVQRLSREINLALSSPELRARLATYAVEPEGSTPDALAALVSEDVRAWKRLIRETGITLE